MFKHLPRFAITGLLCFVFVLSGCQAQLLPPAGSTILEDTTLEDSAEAEKDQQEIQAVAVNAKESDSENATGKIVKKNVASDKPAKPAKRATVSQETSIIDTIVETIEQPAQESAEEASNPSSEIAATATSVTLVLESVQSTDIAAVPTPVPTQVPPTATPAPPIAYVAGSPIRIHAGPGANYALHGVADQGTTFALVGQANDCQWYQVQHPSVGTAWIASTAGNVTIYNATCPQLPLATN